VLATARLFWVLIFDELPTKQRTIQNTQGAAGNLIGRACYARRRARHPQRDSGRVHSFQETDLRESRFIENQIIEKQIIKVLKEQAAFGFAY